MMMFISTFFNKAHILLGESTLDSYSRRERKIAGRIIILDRTLYAAWNPTTVYATQCIWFLL